MNNSITLTPEEAFSQALGSFYRRASFDFTGLMNVFHGTAQQVDTHLSNSCEQTRWAREKVASFVDPAQIISAFRQVMNSTLVRDSAAPAAPKLVEAIAVTPQRQPATVSNIYAQAKGLLAAAMRGPSQPTSGPVYGTRRGRLVELEF